MFESKLIFKKNIFRKISAGAIILIAVPLFSEISDMLWKTTGKEYHLKNFRTDYDSFLDLMSWQMGTSREVLKSYIGKSSTIEDPRVKALIDQLSPATFAQNMQTINVLELHAEEAGYFKRPEVKARTEFVQKFIMMELYLNEILNKIPVEIKDEDLEDAWVKERKANENLRSVPIEQGLTYMRQKLTRERREFLKTEFLKTIRERYKMQTNPDLEKIIQSMFLESETVIQPSSGQ